MRIVLDCANGAAYKVAPAVLWELGAEVITIGDSRRHNINLKCGSTAPEALCARCTKCAPISASRWMATPTG
jgi:phosphoglucosamine mutase